MPRTLSDAAGAALSLLLGGDGAGALILETTVNLNICALLATVYPSGCCSKETSSSTAVEDAIDANPGRVTVHI